MDTPASRTPTSSRDYLEQIRLRRARRQKNFSPMFNPSTESQSPPQGINTPPATEPVTPQTPPPTQVDTNQKTLSDKKEEELFPGAIKPKPEETVLKWQAPSRPFKKRNAQYYRTVGIIVLLISLILFFAGQFLPIAVVISVGFLAYVLSSVPPENITNKITTYGIRIAESLYYWEELGRFWFEEKYQQDLLKIETVRFPGRVTLLLGNKSKDELTKILSEVLLQEKPELTFFDKSAQWLQKKIPLETTS